jgi:Fe-S cluster assembly iron-binding protein IscA
LGLALDEPQANEKSVNVNGLDVLIDDNIKGFAQDSVVDFISSPYGEMFTVENGLGEC